MPNNGSFQSGTNGTLGTLALSQAAKFIPGASLVKKGVQAPAVPAKDALSEERQTLAFHLCVEALKSGCPGAFTEMFQLGHREPVCIDPLSEEVFAVPMDKLAWVKGKLVAAEQFRREDAFDAVYDEFLQVADYFESERDFDAAHHFHELGLEQCQHSNNKRLQFIAHQNAGAAFERKAQETETLKRSIEHYEHALRLVATEESGELSDLRKRALASLIRVYNQVAAHAEGKGDFATARSLYEKGMNAAQLNDDAVAEGDANHRLGNITVLLGDLNKALEYQKRFLQCSKRAEGGQGSAAAEGRARAALATLQADLGQTEQAATSLQRSLQLAEQAGDTLSVCDTCTKLGLLYTRAGNHQRAAEFLNQNYNVAVTSGDKRLIVKAKIMLGLAKGNCTWADAFVERICHDPDVLLKWKSKNQL